MSDLRIDIEGFPKLLKKIQELSDDKEKRREILGILRNVSKSTIKAAKMAAPISKRPHIARGKKIMPGNLQKSIGNITGKKGQSKDNPTVYVGPRTKGANNGWYGNMVESGHNIYKKGFKRSRSKKNNNASGARKRIEGKFFMKKAYNQTRGQVTQDSEKQVANYIQRRIIKLGN